jgi:hypothetical protein
MHLLSQLLLKIISVFRNIFRYFAAFFRPSSQAGSRDEFPRLAYTGPHCHAEICVSTMISSNKTFLYPVETVPTKTALTEYKSARFS